MSLEICQNCDGMGRDGRFGPNCVLCAGTGLYKSPITVPAVNIVGRPAKNASKIVATMGLCEVCGCRSYDGRCTGKSKFHWWQHAITQRASQGYATVYMADIACARAAAHGYSRGTGIVDRLVEVSRDELEEVSAYLPPLALTEFRAVEQVQAGLCPLWKARIEQKKQLIVAGIFLDSPEEKNALVAAEVTGYVRTQQTKEWVYKTPNATSDVILGLRWLATAWLWRRPTPYPREAHKDLYVRLWTSGFADLWDPEFLHSVESSS